LEETLKRTASAASPRRIRRLAALSTAAAIGAALFAAPAAHAAVSTTITFDELSTRDVDNVSLHGVRFSAYTTPHAQFGEYGAGFGNRRLVGSPSSSVGMTFAEPTASVAFGVDFVTTRYNRVPAGQVEANVDLYSATGALIATKQIIASRTSDWSGDYDYHYFVSRESFSYTGTTPVARVDFRPVIGANGAGWYLDDLTYQVPSQDWISNGDFEWQQPFGGIPGWTVTGDTFIRSAHTDWGWGGPFNHKGTVHIWGHLQNGDAGTGTLTSQTWTLNGSPYVDFLVGGGNDIANLYVALVVDGVEVKKATGTNDERYRRVIWDVTPWIGRDAYFKVVDSTTGGWGHINVDDFHTNTDTVASATFGALANKGFETGTLSGWTTTGDAFADGDVTSDTTWWGGSFGHVGNKHVWGYKAGGDADTGTLSSAAFTLGGLGKVDFLVSGGQDAAKLNVALVRVSDNAVLFSATGANSETYSRVTWDASEYIGEQLKVVVTDTATGGWGHINVDDVNVQVHS
jgi:hypothetical protein